MKAWYPALVGSGAFPYNTAVYVFISFSMCPWCEQLLNCPDIRKYCNNSSAVASAMLFSCLYYMA